MALVPKRRAPCREQSVDPRNVVPSRIFGDTRRYADVDLTHLAGD
jgi:hypothetical protein